MAEDDDASASRPTKRACVALTDDTTQADETNNALVVGNRVSENAVRLSGLLSGIEDAEGLASLPGHLSPEDVRLWETANQIDCSFPTDELVTVLKVADALCASDTQKWVSEVAGRIQDTDWGVQEQANLMLSSILRLPHHIIHATLYACMYERKVFSLEKMLENLPLALHTAIISAAASSYRGNLILNLNSPGPELTLLSSVNVPSPGLQSVYVAYDSYVEADSSTGALLGHALSAHPSLTSVAFSDVPLPPQWLRTFSACLAPNALPHLVHLNLSTFANPSSYVEVAACARLLPSLTYIDALFLEPDVPTESRVSLSTYSRLVASPAFLPHLQRLRVRERCSHSDDLDDEDNLPEGPGSCVPTFLSLIHAPALKNLRLHLGRYLPKLRPFIANIMRYTCLEQVDVHARLEWGNARLDSHDTALPALASVSVESVCPVSPMTIAAALIGLGPQSLTSLDLIRADAGIAYTHDARMMTGNAYASATAWKQLYPAIRRCTGMKQLRLSCLGCAPESHFDSYLLYALSPLSQLQSLTLLPVAGTVAMPLSCSIFSTLLPKLSSLEELVFVIPRGRGLDRDQPTRCMFDLSPVQEMCSVLAKLQHLTKLGLGIKGVTPQLLASLLQELSTLQHVIITRGVLSHEIRDGEDLTELDTFQKRFDRVQIDWYMP